MPGRGRPRTLDKAENTHEILVGAPGGSKLSTPQRAASLVPTGGLTSPNLRPFFLSALIYLKCGLQKPSRYREGRCSASLGLGEGGGTWLRPCVFFHRFLSSLRPTFLYSFGSWCQECLLSLGTRLQQQRGRKKSCWRLLVVGWGFSLCVRVRTQPWPSFHGSTKAAAGGPTPFSRLFLCSSWGSVSPAKRRADE